MKYLLDTNTFIWLDNDPSKLTTTVSDICADTRNTLLCSMASVWEMQIKRQLGKLVLRLPLSELVHSQRRENSIELLPIEFHHILALADLPAVHKDPFDRLLVAQAITENAVLISNDPYIKQYPVSAAW
jgi:PIN domain nuclease of toxin-antitoxin system